MQPAPFYLYEKPLPVQPVDATLSKRWIRQVLPQGNGPVWLYSLKT